MGCSPSHLKPDIKVEEIIEGAVSETLEEFQSLGHLETGVKEIVRLVKETYAPEPESEELNNEDLKLSDFNSPKIDESPTEPNSPKTVEMPDTDATSKFQLIEEAQTPEVKMEEKEDKESEAIGAAQQSVE